MKTNSMPPKRSHDPERILRLVVVAVVSFTIAIALPFIAPRIIFPASMVATDQSAPVIVDGRAVFRVADTASTMSARTRADIISHSLQRFVAAQQQPEIFIETVKAGNLATVWLAYPSQLDPQVQTNFTVTSADTSGTLSPTEQAEIWANDLRQSFSEAKAQRQEAYIQRHLWQIPMVPILAAFAHWLTGQFWRRYLYHFLRSLMMEGEGDRSKFTTVNLFLNATLLLLRTGIWISALLYVTDVFPDSRQFSQRLIAQLTESFTAKTIPLGSAPISVLDIFRVLVLVLIVTVIARIISNLLKQRILQETGINRGVQEAIAVLLRYSLIFIGCIVVLQASGINLSSLTLLASALGVGAGLGLQNIVKDIGSGLILVFERPIQVGEFVQIGEHIGTVERIGARSAEIRTVDQVSVIVPNSKFLETEVINWSHRNPISRIRIPVSVAYESDPKQVNDLLIAVGRQHPDVLATPPVQVLFRKFGDSAFQFELLVWISQPSRQFIIQSELLFKLVKALRQESIEIPFPQRDVHIRWHDLPARDKP